MTIKFSIPFACPPHKNAGFSLVELSIVLVIVSLLAAAVTGGMALKRNLELQNIMGDVSQLTQATEQFTTMYGGLPGDLFNATEKFGVSNTSNGNGNALIDTAGEQMLAFQHLSLAGLIKGSYPNSWSVQSVMKTALPNTTFYFGTLENGTALTFTSIGSDQNSRMAALVPADMYYIDRKYDDGMPNTGNIRAFTGAGVSPCTLGANVTDNYAMDNEDISCYFTIIIRKAFQ